MTLAYLDVESRSRVPINQSIDRYLRDAECIVVTWAVEDGPAQIWDSSFPEPDSAFYLRTLIHSKVQLVAHNAMFDRAILHRALGYYTPETRWLCTRAQAYAHGLPGSLELLGMVLGLPEDKQKLVEDGKLIQTFCVPRADGSFWQPSEKSEEWIRFKEYAKRDVEALRETHKRLPSHNYQGDNLALYHLDQRINNRGFQFDERFARSAVDFLAQAKERGDRKMNAATRGVVQAATQREKLLTHLQTVYKLDIPNMRAADLHAMLEGDDLTPDARALIEMRLEGAKSSGAKYRRGLQAVGPGSRIRHAHQFNGAGRTGRFSHKAFQPGNMRRPVVSITQSDGEIKQVPVKAKYIDDVVMPGVESSAALDWDLA